MSDEEVQYSKDETILIAGTIVIYIYIMIAYNEMILNLKDIYGLTFFSENV